MVERVTLFFSSLWDILVIISSFKKYLSCLWQKLLAGKRLLMVPSVIALDTESIFTVILPLWGYPTRNDKYFFLSYGGKGFCCCPLFLFPYTFFLWLWKNQSLHNIVSIFYNVDFFDYVVGDNKYSLATSKKSQLLKFVNHLIF